ncbi:MAG TPA: hypothetical protein ENH10_05600 [Bacteroidetes bacterium]|nr:hypothetical protein [Bacteroidota bacterium]HEX04619.1 hypothetical protein [Bacteroidota bacterium]
MAETRHYEPRGSLILKILSVILIVVLIASVLYPEKLWKKQDSLIEASRLKMDNINFIAQRHYKVHQTYVSDLDSLIRFIQSDSIMVRRAAFEMDKMSLYNAPYDSFIVGFADKFHFTEIEVLPFSQGRAVGAEEAETATVDSLVLKMIPKPEFENSVKPILYKMVSTSGIHYYYPKRGVEDKTVIVWGDGKLERDYLPFEEYLIPSTEYVLTVPLEGIEIDPISGEEYRLNLNASLDIEGKLEYKLAADGEPENPVLGKELYTNLFVNRLARQARARLDTDMQRDSTLYAMQLELQSDYFDVEIELLTPRKTTTVESNTEIVVPVDSVYAYQDSLRLRDMLFTTMSDSLIRVWTEEQATQDIIASLSFTESVGITKIDTVGVTIRPPMDDTYKLASDSFLDKIFSVGPIENPGNIENNDLSWSESR